MRRMPRALWALVLVLSLMLSTAVSAREIKTDRGLETLSMLSGGQYAELFDNSTAAMRAALLAPEGFASLWQALQLQFGAYSGARSAGAEEAQGFTTHRVEAEFERATVLLGISFDAEDRLAGISALEVRPASQQAETQGEAVLLRPGAPDETEALLRLPEGQGSFPLVILIHGSGPNDKDETAYGMAPFRDLAEGMAGRGVATLRYDKYTYAHSDVLACDPQRAASFTMKEEYVDDALAAYAALSGDARFSGVFLLGHSQGASAAPRAAAALPEGSVKGLILLCGTVSDKQNVTCP